MKAQIIQDPTFGIGITILAYLVGVYVNKKWKWLHPLIFISTSLIVALSVFRIPYEAYKVGGDYITFLLGPATVALAVPIYKNATQIRFHLVRIVSSVTLGTLSAILSAAFLVWVLGGNNSMICTMMPKCATTPISIELVKNLGGLTELGAVFTVLTGLSGAMFGPALLRVLGVQDGVSIGTALGMSSHALGTARSLEVSELAGSVGGFSMGFTGILTALCMIPFYS